MMQLFTYYGIDYCPFTGDEKDPYIPFYRVENEKRIAYVFSNRMADIRDWSRIKNKFNVDEIKLVAMIEPGEDSEALKN